MRRQIYLWSILFLVGLLAACQPQAQVLPTLIDLNANATNDAATAANVAATSAADAVTQTAVAIAHQPTPLPPTWTPAPAPTQPPVQIVSAPPSVTAPGATGTIYYIFNGDSIAALKADASSEQLILVGSAPSELTLSPDGKFLAYVGKGNGSARELFITSLDGTYVQQVSCLGFSRVTAPGWSPDSQTLAFAGSQSPNGPLGIYTAGVVGSGQCPTGNNQHLLTQTQLNQASAMTWSNDGTMVFFTSGSVYGFNIATNVFYPPLVLPTGYGPDQNSVYRPGADELYYLRSYFDSKTQRLGGTLFHIIPTDMKEFPVNELRGTAFGALQFRWSRDGDFVVASTDRDILVQDMLMGTANLIKTGSNFFPQAIFSPDGEWVAYVDGKPGALTIPEIFVVGHDGQNQQQITTHQDGTISDLNWGE